MACSARAQLLALALALVALACRCHAQQPDLPEEFVRCRQADPKLSECLRRAVPDALRKMTKGIKALGVPALEPLLVSGVQIDSGGGPVRIQQTYSNVRLHGLTTSDLITYKADLKHYRLRTDSLTENLQFVGDYVMQGRILLLPIQGKGRANITMLHLVVKHDLIGVPVERDGVRYMHIKEYRVRFEPRKVLLHFTNLFNGDKLLGDQMNRFLNENSELVFGELREAYENSLSSVFQDLTNTIFDKVPMDTIFPAPAPTPAADPAPATAPAR